MTTLRIPMSGLLLVSHLAAYGLGAVLEGAGERALIGHDPDSLEIELLVETNVDQTRAVKWVREAARRCKHVVDADIAPNQPAIYARLATNVERAQQALLFRERLLDEAEKVGDTLSAGLIAGLGAPATWLQNGKPSHGATGLDGVAGNSTSDFVRGVLRNARPIVENASDHELHNVLVGDGVSASLSEDERDKTGWAPPGTRVHRVYQWLAALGLCLLPVGLSAGNHSRTPGMWREGANAGVRLPVLPAPVATARLRALLQLPVLTASKLKPTDEARLRAFGVHELVGFRIVRGENDKMTAFSFGRGERLDL